MKFKKHQIMVHIIEARGLSALDGEKNTSDSLCIVQIGPNAGIQEQTETKYETVNPVWEAKFVFEGVELSDVDFQREKLSIKVYSRNDFFSNDLIGSYEFALNHVHRQQNHQFYRHWMPLTLPDNPGNIQGFLLATVYVLMPGDPTPSADGNNPEDDVKILVEPEMPDRRPFILNVLTYRAQHLLATQNASSMNPFASVRFNGNTIQSEYQADTRNPMWNTKMEMPFFHPLRSDSVEIQLWNMRWGLPDVLIGEVTVNYYQMGLTHKDWGPKWLNFYTQDYSSKETSFLGDLKQSFTASATGVRSEYVGRLLLRMSTSAREEDDPPPLLMSMPCNPAADPPGEEFCLQFLLYSGSEIPVLGGHVMVEVCFGTKRKQSSWKLGRDGVFKWNEKFEMMKVYGPEDLLQLHDVILNVFHKVGGSRRKIGYERIPVTALLPDRSFWHVNGKKVTSKWAKWHPQWRSMNHIYPDEQHAHICPGFVLCNIGFGLKKQVPENIPPVAAEKEMSYNLRFYLYQGANLPAGNDNGTSDVMLVLRFAGKSYEFPTVEDTLFPFWYRHCELKNCKFDPRHAPSIFIMLYHVDTLDYILLGRCEILTEHLLNDEMQNVNMRFRLEHDQMTPEQRTREPTDLDPYVLGSFELFPTSNRKGYPLSKFWKNKNKDGTPAQGIPGEEYCLKLETIGVRNLPMGLEITKPVVEYSFPKLSVALDTEGETNVKVKYAEPEMDAKTIDGSKLVGTSTAMLKPATFRSVKIPKLHPMGFPLCIRFFNNDGGDKIPLGVVYVPLMDYLCDSVDSRRNADEKPFDSPDFYVYHTEENQNEDEDEEKYDQASGSESSEEPDSGADEMAGAQLVPIFVEDDFHINKDDFEWALDLGDGHLNMTETTEPDKVFASTFQPNGGGESSDEEEDAAGDEDEVVDRAHKIFDIDLHSGKNISALGRINENMVNSTVKTYIRLFKLCLEDKEKHKLLDVVKQSNLIADLKPSFKLRWIARLYIFNAQNLTPRERTFGSFQTANPYVIVKNGEGASHAFNNRQHSHTGSLNPDFFQVYELQTKIPEHASLELAVWDRDDIAGDNLIGTYSLDVEGRILNDQRTGQKEWLQLMSPLSSTSQGKIQVKLDILTEDQARQQRADDMDAPRPEEYELRMVIWNTRDVSFPDPKKQDDDVDQTIICETNFEGEYEGDMQKKTDVAWYCASGRAEWNWRMTWRLQVPCKLPRLKLQMWDANLVADNTAIGEVIYNLKPFFDKALSEKKPVHQQAQEWLPFSHPNWGGKKIGSVNIELWLVSKIHADKTPVGEGQEEPNREPFLPTPAREAPPWAVASRGLDWLANQRLYMMIAAGVAVILMFTFGIIFLQSGVLTGGGAAAPAADPPSDA